MTTESLDRFAAGKLEALARRRLARRLEPSDRLPGAVVERHGRRLISFSCNDYLGLSHHPDVVAASVEATRRYGAGAGASRLITGSNGLYERLEAQLAEIKGSEAAIVFGSGYLTNVGVIPVLAGSADLILIDELSHSCLLTGARVSRARVVEFRHNDASHAAEILQAERDEHRHCLLVTEGVFSMEGDLAPLPALEALARRHDAWLMTDDAHALGVVGRGRGSSFAFEPAIDVPLQMGTLSKAVGSYGGYLCASEGVVELLRNRARSFAYSTGLPPGTVAAASRALEIIARDPDLVGRPLAKARRFTGGLGLPPARSAIVPIVVGSAKRALDAGRRFAEAGFLVAPIRPPTVPVGTSRLRFAFSAEHRDDDIDRLIDVTAAIMAGA